MHWLRFLGIYALLSALLGGLLLLQAFPFRPQTATGWTLLFALALPITLVGELAANKLLNNRVGRFVEEETKEQRLSSVRILFVLLMSLSAMVVISGLYRIWLNFMT